MSAANCQWCRLSFWRPIPGHPEGGLLACTQINDGYRVRADWQECDRYQRAPGADDNRGVVMNLPDDRVLRYQP